MRTKDEIIEQLFTLLNALCEAGALFEDEIVLLNDLEGEYYIQFENTEED